MRGVCYLVLMASSLSVHPILVVLLLHLLFRGGFAEGVFLAVSSRVLSCQRPSLLVLSLFVLIEGYLGVEALPVLFFLNK